MREATKLTGQLRHEQLQARELDDAHKNPKAKCPFVPTCEMAKKFWGTGADPVMHKGEWERRLSKVGKQLQFNH